MNRNTLLGTVLVCSALCFGALHYFTPVQNKADIKIEQKKDVPAPNEALKENTVESVKKNETMSGKKQDKEAMVSKTGSDTEQNKEKQAIDEKKNDKSYVYIKKSTFKLYFINDEGREVFSAGCALGKNPGQKEKEGDMKTPTGTFYVDEILDASYWTHDFGDGKGVIEGAYGPWFISINTDEISKGKWGGIGIHGTHDPASIGTMASEGCIRLENSQVEVLKTLVRVGTKVVIEE